MSKTWYGHHIDTIKGNDYVLFKDKEIERLTAESTEWESKCYKYQDIIDELEKSWKKQQEHYRYIKDNRYRTFLGKNLDKLKELKEEKNEKK